MKSRTKSIVKGLVQLLVVALVVAGVWRAFRKAADELADQRERVDQQVAELDAQRDAAADPAERAQLQARRVAVERQRFRFRDIRPGWLLLACIVYAIALAPSWLYWHRVLLVMQQQPRKYESLRAYYIGHLGKYVPGKALVVILRASLVRSERTTSSAAALAVFVETLTTMAVGAFVAALCLAVTSSSTWLIGLSVALMAGAGLPTLPPLFRRAVRLLKVKGLDQELGPLVDRIDGRLLLTGWALGAVNWAGMGLCLYCVLAAMPTDSLASGALSWQQLPLLTGAVSLAAVAGFLSLLPGGIGIRELVVTELLAGPFGPVLAVVSAVVLRFAWLLCEVTLSVILYLRKPVTAAPPSP